MKYDKPDLVDDLNAGDVVRIQYGDRMMRAVVYKRNGRDVWVELVYLPGCMYRLYPGCSEVWFLEPMEKKQSTNAFNHLLGFILLLLVSAAVMLAGMVIGTHI